MRPEDDAVARALRALRHDGAAEPSGALMTRIAGDAAAMRALAAARAAPPAPSDLLMARVARDAARNRPRRWRERGAWAGLAAAGIAGLTLGLAGPGWLLPDGAAGAVQAGGEVLIADLAPTYDFQYLDSE
ncbi:hypothetical protein DC366_03055 [Pelagivirga sediminicola]|uniref:Uncharacterized protein n=2 Tax=Pelagivirga sediminicola TaxID=2170575 RepID=A0A2T7GBX6_9RHOB|nr:hypothetical protein DC366_03055 [Pelagivirga sediminicola]